MSLGVCSYAGAIIGTHAREYLAALLTSETIEFGGIACVQIAQPMHQRNCSLQ